MASSSVGTTTGKQCQAERNGRLPFVMMVMLYESVMGRSIVTVLVGCMSLLGCASVFLQTDDFPDKLKQGCDSLESCEQLETEAKARVARCQDNTIGYIRCSDANADLTVASSYANRWRLKVQREDQERREREQRREQEKLQAEQRQR